MITATGTYIRDTPSMRAVYTSSSHSQEVTKNIQPVINFNFCPPKKNTCRSGISMTSTVQEPDKNFM